MASGREHFKASETKGQAQEKSNQMAEAATEKAQQTKDQAAATAGAAGERMKEAKNQTASFFGEKTGVAKQKTPDTGAVKQKASDAAQSARDTTQPADKGILQQTGERVMGVAQGTVEAVKNTLGMAENKVKDTTTTPRE